MIKITIKNLPQIRAAFRKSPMLMTKELNIAIKRTVIGVERQSKINTPVLTGRLRASHKVSFSSLRGEVGTHTNYDYFIHEGTKFMKARPFLMKAVESEEKQTDENFTRAVQNVLDKIASDV